jgi:hypothetical protein
MGMDVNMAHRAQSPLVSPSRVRPQRSVLALTDHDFAVSVQICTDYVDCAVYFFILTRNVPPHCPVPRVSYRTSESYDLWSPFL